MRSYQRLWLKANGTLEEVSDHDNYVVRVFADDVRYRAWKKEAGAYGDARLFAVLYLDWIRIVTTYQGDTVIEVRDLDDATLTRLQKAGRLWGRLGPDPGDKLTIATVREPFVRIEVPFWRFQQARSAEALLHVWRPESLAYFAESANPKGGKNAMPAQFNPLGRPQTIHDPIQYVDADGRRVIIAPREMLRFLTENPGPWAWLKRHWRKRRLPPLESWQQETPPEALAPLPHVLSATFLVGFNVEGRPTWDLRDVQERLGELRRAQMEAMPLAPAERAKVEIGATLTLALGIWGRVVEGAVYPEDSARIQILNLSGVEDDNQFVLNMKRLAAALGRLLRQESVLVQIVEPTGVVRETFDMRHHRRAA